MSNRSCPGTGPTASRFLRHGAGPIALLSRMPARWPPPAAQAGAPLSGYPVTFTNVAALTASGRVDPPSSPASRIAHWVTATAEVTVSNSAGPLVSGLILRCEISTATS